jgi:hypothetical protein
MVKAYVAFLMHMSACIVVARGVMLLADKWVTYAFAYQSPMQMETIAFWVAVWFIGALIYIIGFILVSKYASWTLRKFMYRFSMRQRETLVQERLLGIRPFGA